MPTELPEWDVDLTPHDRVNKIHRQVDAWVRAPELTSLARAFGGHPPDGPASDLLEWYDSFSESMWDFRKGYERNLAEKPRLNDEQIAATMTAAHTLGLAAPSRTTRTAYDYCLIPGGLIRACITRPRYAAALQDAGVKFGAIIALGGFRPLRGDEQQIAEHLGMDVVNEFSAMDMGVREAFGIRDAPVIQEGDGSTENHDWRIHQYLTATHQVIAAPSTEPASRRANSADTFNWWAKRQRLPRGAHILLVTNPIYVPYQGAAATQTLGMPFDVQIETVGISTDAADLGPYTQTFDASNYLQEIRSSIRGMSSLARTATL